MKTKHLSIMLISLIALFSFAPLAIANREGRQDTNVKRGLVKINECIEERLGTDTSSFPKTRGRGGLVREINRGCSLAFHVEVIDRDRGEERDDAAREALPYSGGKEYGIIETNERKPKVYVYGRSASGHLFKMVIHNTSAVPVIIRLF